MKEMIDTYGEDMVDYYLTGYSADLKTVNSSNTSNTGTSTTTKKGNCSRCSGTGKVTKHYGNSWNKKPGYQYGKTCGACNGTGWVK
jgi:DnaJ-class molecular chaperone